MPIVLKWQDVSGLVRLSNALGSLGDHKKHLVLQRAVNHTGAKARTQVVRALAKQTGLPNKVIQRAVRVKRASGASVKFYPGGSLDYVMTTRGGDIALKYFKAREVRRGVTASPFGKRSLFEGAFMRGGRFPGRVHVPRFNGHVFERVGTDRHPYELKKSGVIIPDEMLTGATAAAFHKVVERDLPARVSHEIDRLCPGIFS